MIQKMTAGSPAKHILLFTIPLLVGNLFQQFYGIADTLIVGRAIGINALAAVGSTTSLFFLLVGFVIGLTTGFSIVTAQCFGANDTARLRQSFASGIVLSAGMGIVLTVIGVTLSRWMLEAMQTPPLIMEDACRFISVVFGGIWATMMFNYFANIMRALGNSRSPLAFLAVGSVLNVALELLFILSFGMGVEGAALATVISQIVAAGCCLRYIIAKLPILKLERENWRPNRGILLSQLKIGLPMGFQASLIAIGSIVLQIALNGLGEISVAAYTAAQKIDLIAALPMMSFGLTMATYTAQNYGAGNIGRIRRGVFQCALMSVSFALVMAVVNISAGHWLVELFVGTEQTHVVSLAQTYLVINGSAYWVLALLFITRYTLQGLGQSVVPTIAGIMELVMRAFAAIVLTQMWGFTGACWANPLAWIGSCVPLCIAYFFTIRKLVQTNSSGICNNAVRDGIVK